MEPGVNPRVRKIIEQAKDNRYVEDGYGVVHSAPDNPDLEQIRELRDNGRQLHSRWA